METVPQINPAIQDPLGPAHLAQIKQTLQLIKNARAQVMKAQQAGIDVSAHAQSLDDSEKKLLAVKQAYFPNQ